MIDFDYELGSDKTIHPMPEIILVHGMEAGEQKIASGIIIPDDTKKESGIRPRWCYVYAVGSKIDYVKPGDYILVAHGRWSRGIRVKEQNGDVVTVRRVDPNDILLVQN